MSLTTRLDKIEAALRTLEGGEPSDEPWLAYRLSDWAEACPLALEETDIKNIPQWKASALDQLVAAGKIRETDRERVTFIVRTIVHPPERTDDPTSSECCFTSNNCVYRKKLSAA